MDFTEYLSHIRTKYPNFESFKNHVSNTLRSRKQIGADLTKLPEDHIKAGVLFSLIVPKGVTNGNSVIDHIFVLLEKRSQKLSKHPGQMAFPGGTQEVVDRNLIDTAYREAQEEVGIDPEQLEFIDYLDEFVSSSKILVKPVVSWLILDYDLDNFIEKVQTIYSPKTTESDATIVVPLTHLLNPKNYKSTPYIRKGVKKGFVRFFDVHTYFDNDHIWGLTASMIKRFLDQVFPDNLLIEGKN